ncbi:MAG: class II aldolase/adducin family protein [Candidatus Zixiibacteriota bacterium]|nr:MAG: class II aldolase/adducin family protein [candidate division Zixibacteria bacterium]
MSIETMSNILINFCRLLYKNGLIAGFDGNYSAKLDNNSILITPSGLAKGFLEPEDLIVVDLSGNKISGRREPSSETAMHLQVYQNRPEINACCHAHPPYSTTFAVTGKQLPDNILPEVLLNIGNIGWVDYIPTGVAEEWVKLALHIRKNNAVLLANHGVLTLGQDIGEAYFRMETVEHLARIAFLGKNLGELKALDSKEITRLTRIRANKKR